MRFVSLCSLIFIFTLSAVILYYLINLQDINNEVDENFEEGLVHKNEPYFIRYSKHSDEYSHILKNFLLSFKYHGNEDALLNIIHIYIYGSFPYTGPNKLIGIRLINRILIDPYFSKDLQLVCKMLMEDSSMLVYDDNDYSSTNELPDNIIDIIDETISYQIENKIKISNCTTTVSYKRHTIDIQPVTENIPSTTMIRGNRTIVDNTDRTEINTELEENIIPTITVLNDSQNVHNHSIQNISKIIIDKLKSENTFTENTINFFIEIKSIQLAPDEVDDVTAVINSFTDNIHSKYNASEKDVFSKVFERILKNDTNKADLLDIFIKNLLSSIEYGSIVCSTGKITRMLSTFDVIDEDLPNLVPDWVLREEIANMALSVRHEILKNCSKTELDNYNKTTDVDKNMYELLQTRMKDELMSRCKSSYIDSELLSETALSILLKDFLDSF